MKPFAKLALGLFIAGILLMAFGLMFAPKERKSLVDQQSPTGQIRAVPTEDGTLSTAQPPEAGQPAQTTEPATR